MVEVEVVSSDGESIKLPIKIAHHSVLIKEMMDDDDESEVSIPLPNVKYEVLKKVVEFMEYYDGSPMEEIEKPLKSVDMKDIVPEWYSKYVDLGQDILFEVILAANYMDIKPLLDLCCAKVASMIKGKTPEDIRNIFNIENDFTPQEEAQIREENKWCEEVGSA